MQLVEINRVARGLFRRTWRKLRRVLRLPLTREDLNGYLGDLAREYAQPGFVPRFFMSHEEWNKLSPDQYYRRHGIFRETYPGLDKLLDHRKVVILGEPGGGKTCLARAVVLHIARVAQTQAEHSAPIQAHLKDYQGSLAEFLERSVTDRRVLTRPTIDGQPLRRFYVLDGLDEVPGDTEEGVRAVHEIEDLLVKDPLAHLLISCRQAHYEGIRKHFSDPPLEFHILDFSDDDIRKFLESRGVDYDAFIKEVRRVDFEESISNPFILDTATKYFSDRGELGKLRSEIVSHVVETLIASRTRFATHRQRRALRMLALAMEIYCRNVLSNEEAASILQQSMPVGEAEARRLLAELTHSILMQTAGGLSFQMASYGEYLAAEELRDAQLGRILELVFKEETRTLNESWSNTLSYLIEINAEVRRYFVVREPRYVLASSPSAFADDERTDLVNGILDDLARKQEYLVNHPLIKDRQLARHLTETCMRRLLNDVGSADPIMAANAFVLLAHTQNSDPLERAIRVAFDRTKHAYLRRSAIFAVANLGDSGLIPGLMANLDTADPLHLSLVDCIAALMDERAIPTVFPLLLRENAMVSSAFYRFREIRSEGALHQVLDYLIANPRDIIQRRTSSYLDPIWDLLDSFWTPDVATKIARLLGLWEESGIQNSTIEPIDKIVKAISEHDAQGLVCRIFLAEMLGRDYAPRYLMRTIGRIIRIETAHWLLAQQPPEEFIRRVAISSPSEVGKVLKPIIGEVDQAQREWVRRVQREEEERAAAVRLEIQEQQTTVTSSETFTEVLAALKGLTSTRWPELSEDRREWLRTEVSRYLGELDCLNTIVWHDRNSLTAPIFLDTILAMVSHYKLHVDDDVPLVQSLLGMTAEPQITYYKRFGLTDNAKAEFDRLLADPDVSIGAIPGFLRLLEETDYSSGPVLKSLTTISCSSDYPEHLRVRAVNILDMKGITDAQLEALARDDNPNIAREAADLLIRRQHRPTIERRLAQIIGDDTEIRAGEVEFWEDSPFRWVSKIKTPEVWDRLATLRERALTLQLPRVVGYVTDVMARIDLARVSDVVRQQIPIAPVAWQDTQRLRALEYEHDARRQATQKTSIDDVVRKMTQKTTMKRLKVWCEGVNDVPVFDVLKREVLGANTREVVVQSLGSWPHLLNENYDFGRLLDGCYDAIVVIDGDRARDWSKPARPYGADTGRLQRALRAVGIPLFVLERYGIENYFPRNAVQAVLGQPLPAGLVIRDDQELTHQIPGFSKRRNKEVAKRMSLADLKGTDLVAVFEEIRRRAQL